MGKRVAVCGAIDFNARSTSFRRCILTRSVISKPCMIAAERMPGKYDLIVVYLQPLRAVLLAQFISACSLRGNGLRFAVVQYLISASKVERTASKRQRQTETIDMLRD